MRSNEIKNENDPMNQTYHTEVEEDENQNWIKEAQSKLNESQELLRLLRSISTLFYARSKIPTNCENTLSEIFTGCVYLHG